MTDLDPPNLDAEDLGDLFRAHQAQRQAKKAQNREQSARIFQEKQIPFTSHNLGAHLIVEGPSCFIDYWPGTGKWISRDGARGFGLRNLLQHIGAPQ
jgi:hypothetical protein